MSDSHSHSRSVLARYRPLIYLLSGVAAAYAIVYIRQHLLHPAGPGASSSPGASRLHRRRAIRRQRRNNSNSNNNNNDLPEESFFSAADTPSSRAIAHLEQLERHNGVYGTFRIETEDGRRVESGLLPSLLATRDQLMEQVGVPQAHAERMREMMEDTFLESFLALDFPSSHRLDEGSPEREYLIAQLQRRGISRAGIERALVRFNADDNYGADLRLRRQNGERVTLSTSSFPYETEEGESRPTTGAQNNAAGDGGDETVVDDQSVFSWRDGAEHNNDDVAPVREGQNLLNLLYHIAEDQARRDGYIHRGVTCNSCGAMPIQGIRYRCANCIDYDLCETCEAMQVHIKTHMFYKVRIPAPFLGSPRQSQPVWYPGKPTMMPRSLPRALFKRLMKETGFENTELDALWDQFRCLANHEWEDDPNKVYMAIDRKTFDRCFVPNTSIRPPPPSLIYDRMFAFYDTNNDGLIGLEEFLKGIASLNNKSNDERLHRVFRGYDIDNDGYVERKDFLRIFRAYYALSRELTRDMVAGLEDDFLEGGARDVVLGSQPISSAFPGSIPNGDPSRTGEGKRVNHDGDLEIVDNEGVLRLDGTDTGDRYSVIGDAAVRSYYGVTRPVLPTARRHSISGSAQASGSHGRREPGAEEAGTEADDASSSSGASDRWPPPEHIRNEDIVSALGAYVPVHEITDPVDRARIGTAVYNRMYATDQVRLHVTRRMGVHDRWRRRGFYTDEEDGATAPVGYQSDLDAASSDEEEDNEVDESQPAASESHPPSPRSRSSSKVRFQDDLTDDYDVRSNPSTSSRSILVSERWGGFEVPEVERDVGKEILYQVTQQGFNELLDILFKPKEDLLMEAYETRAERKLWAREIELTEQMEHGKQAAREISTVQPEFEAEEEEGEEEEEEDEEEGAEAAMQSMIRNSSLDELLQRTGYSVQGLENVQALAPPTPDMHLFDDNVESLIDPTETEAMAAGLAPSTNPPLEPQGNGDWYPPPLAISPSSPSLSTSSVASEPAEDSSRPPSAAASYYDPTLPHHRPNEEDLIPTSTTISFHQQLTSRSASPSPSLSPTLLPRHQTDLPTQLRLDPSGSTSFPAPTSHFHASSPEAEATAPKLSPSPIQPLPPPSSTLPKQRPGSTLPPSPVTLSRWAYLNKVEREAKERGGSGAKLNFEEFAQRMAMDRGRTLAFVASWIEMASF
ncbi:EF hand domain protein [Aspergillus saccharolyticus JOP 1030-1]|uniref:EF hand domain protein n=1 Tax=Aspergillus saccharolyticus JOP 1030-1 TaxID=1450539 RepID=A0A318ZNC1_9EURO|nr:hypothetical protein BP01DRAFT_353344 [Aspergillus saccharolyticus JOP 1030-1]PYH49026.1 hypothetical protein BP01DRAFT_353344 [Aspergillus saccharolyticus JOP 1030-1]